MKRVSILIAARNEASNILTCLEAITHLTYPADALEVFIGDDQSEDNTPALVMQFIQHKPNFHLFPITHTVGQAKGKANVLAQLAQHATSDYIFMTDADVQLPPDWIQHMLAACNSHTGIITGATLIKGNRLFHYLQAIDWAYALGSVKLASDWQVPITAMGNNMMVTKMAYEATGGYAHLPFSVTEDYALFQAIVCRGFEFMQLLQPEVLAFTKPALTFHELLQQRKRWAHGAMQLPWYFVLFFLIQALSFPLILFLVIFFPLTGIFCWFVKWLLQSLFIGVVLHRLRQGRLLKYLLAYEFYSAFVSLLTLIYYLLPGKIQWKGREY